MKNLCAACVLLLGALIATGCGASERAANNPADSPIATPSAGRIRGTVRLEGNPPVPAFEPVSQNQDVCGRQVRVTRLALGKDRGVRSAFVYLEDVPASGPLREQAVVPVEQSRCQYLPRAVALRAGTKLDIANGDPILHNVHARQPTDDGYRTIFNIAQPVRGQRTVVDLPLTKPGVVALTCEAGHPWMTAYVLVADHPYTAVTDENGNFAIADVPPGTYRIRMWHEGVRLIRVLKSVQQYEFEEPYEKTGQVVVSPGGDARVDFAFELRRQG